MKFSRGLVLLAVGVAALGFVFRDRAEVKMKQAADLSGRRALLLGATNGIGLGIAKELSARGAHVTVVGRNAGQSLAEVGCGVFLFLFDAQRSHISWTRRPVPTCIALFPQI